MTRKGRGKTGYEETKEKEGKLFGKEGSLSFLLGIPLHESKRMGEETQDTHVFLGRKIESWKSWKISVHKGAYSLRLIILQPGLELPLLGAGMTTTAKCSIFVILTKELINTQSKQKGTVQMCDERL